MDKLTLIKALLSADVEAKGSEAQSSFLEIGKIYCFRTVTMIYVGRLKTYNQSEILISEAAWIPETARWQEFIANGDHNEAEPYAKDVVLNRGAMLDITEFPKLITKQK